MHRRALATLTLIALMIGACRWLLPDEMVVNADLAHLLFGRGIDAPTPEVVDARIQAPEGFQVQLWADQVPNARLLHFTPAGDLLVSQPRRGQILLIRADADGDGRADGQRVLLDGLDRPHGLDLLGEQLYIAEASAIRRVGFSEDGPGSGRVVGRPVRLVDDLPEGGNHWSRTLRFGPDGGLYLSVGSSCNVCEEEDPRRAALLRFEPDGSGAQIFASGLRNSVGFDWQPGTNDLYATDNGRDLLGDDEPPCELNRIVRGGFYGWPYAHGNRKADPEFGEGHEDRITRSIPPAHEFAAHNAPLGITFVRQPDPPAELAGAALVALHGSWNRSTKDGYKVVSLHWNERGEIEERDFLVGFNVAEDVIGRPVDVAEGPDGAFYVSDDYAGAIYRVAFEAAPETVHPPRPEPLKDGGLATSDPLAGLDAATRHALVARGQALFAAEGCGRCHLESEAEPGVAVKQLKHLAQRFSLDSLAAFLEAPPPPMPAPDVSPQDRRALAAYVLSTDAD
jgi:glucose/arabinose dehydrogenase